jgi:hypothetical protein
MPKLKLLILDAGVVIRLHELGIWKQVRDRCDIFLSRIVAEKEVLFQPGDEGEYVEDIDLLSDINIGKINIFDVAASELKGLIQEFRPPLRARQTICTRSQVKRTTPVWPFIVTT